MAFPQPHLSPETSISVVTPTLNAAESIGKCVASVRDQTVRGVEHIIMDGCSEDETLDVALRANPDIRHFQSRDHGIYDAMNKALNHCAGDWIFFLGADDRLYSDSTIQRVLPWLDDHADIVYGDVVFRGSGKRYGGAFDYRRILRENICHQALFLRARVFQEVGLFDTRFIALADWEHNLRWFFDPRFHHRYVEQTIALFNENGLSGNVRDEAFYSTRRARYLSQAAGRIPRNFELGVALAGFGSALGRGNLRQSRWFLSRFLETLRHGTRKQRSSPSR